MTDEMKEKLMAGLLRNARIGQLNMVVESGARVNYYEADARSEGTPTEESVKRAVRRLMEEKDKQGHYLVREQEQFYAIKAVLCSARYGFPQKPAEFMRVMHNLELDNLRVPYVYESVRKIHLNRLPQNVELWHQYQDTADEYSMKQVEPAVRLMELLAEEEQK